MKEELNRTINILQVLTNKIVDINQKSTQCLDQSQYNQLTGRIADIEQLFNQKVKTVTIKVKRVSGDGSISVWFNDYQKRYSLANNGFFDSITHDTYSLLQRNYPLHIKCSCTLATARDYIKIIDQNENVLYTHTGIEDFPNKEFILQNGPEIIYIEAACFD